MTAAVDAYRVVPGLYRRVSLEVLCAARRRRRDGWPKLPAIVKAGRSAGLNVEHLAAMFGFMVCHRSPNVVAFKDTMRNSDVSPDRVYDARVKPFYEFFRAAMAAGDEPIDKRRPRYSDDTISN